MNKKILHIDMDGVVANFDAGIKKYDPTLHTGDNHDNYKDRSERVYEICRNNRNIFLELPPIEMAVVCVQSLMPYFDVYFLSTPMWAVPESYTDKRRWIEMYFGNQVADKLILSARKDLIIGDFLVDDRTRHGVDKFKGEHIHFGTDEFPDWVTVRDYLFKNKSA